MVEFMLRNSILSQRENNSRAFFLKSETVLKTGVYTLFKTVSLKIINQAGSIKSVLK